MLQCVAMCCSVFQCVIVCCSVSLSIDAGVSVSHIMSERARMSVSISGSVCFRVSVGVGVRL